MFKPIITKLGSIGVSVSAAVALLVYFIVTLPAVVGSHFLFNLEPYPDGLYYIGQAQSLIKGEGLQLSYADTTLTSVVSPGYSLFLSGFYVISNWPAMFYLANLVAGGLTLICLSQIMRRLGADWLTEGLVLSLYLVHGYILWLPGLPMAENIALLLLSLSVLGLLQTKLSWARAVGLLLVATGLVVTKYAYILIAVAIGIITLWRLIKQRSWRWVAAIGAAGLLVGVGLGLWFETRGIRPWAVFMPGQFGQSSASGLTYYSFENIVPNFHAYLAGLLGQPTTFLWLQVPLTSVATTILALWGIVLGWNSTSDRIRSLSRYLLGLWLAGWPLFLLFYVHDSRYQVLTIIYWSLAAGIWLLESQVRSYRFRWLIFSCVVIIQVLSQLPLLKQVLVNNWLHRSVAWQYQAVVTFDQHFKLEPESQLITALPPFFVAMYQTGDYSVLPLSVHQEFISKQQYVWGSQLNYQQLLTEYERQLVSGKRLYITNAYVTHQAIVIADYELYKEKFQLIPVASGCQQTCDVFELKLKE